MKLKKHYIYLGLLITSWIAILPKCFSQCTINFATYENGQYASEISAKIFKSDIPLKGAEITVTNQSPVNLQTVSFIIKYLNSAPQPEMFENEIVISNFQNLEYLEVRDIECLLGGSWCSIPAVTISLTTTDLGSGPDLSNPTVSSTESQINSLTQFEIDNRLDYHKYEIESEICSKASNSNCTIDEVYNFIKQNREFQAPELSDFPKTPSDVFGVDPLIGIQRAIRNNFLDTLSNNPVVDQQELTLNGGILRFASGLTINIYNLDLSECPTNPNLGAFDPIIVVVDDDAKCITNYTLQGHILHPGKITRCVTSDDCGETVKVTTTGEGLHFCGDTTLGLIFSVLNVFVGEETFMNMDNRLISQFN